MDVKTCGVVYYDQRGAGKTQLKNKSKPSEITLETLLEDLRETVNYVRTIYPDKKLILLGHSWGSILGIEYVKKFPETVDAYVGMGQVVDFKRGERVAYEHCFELACGNDKRKLSKIGDYPNSVTEENVNEKCLKFRKIQAKYGLTGYSGGSGKLAKIFIKSPVFRFPDISVMRKAMTVNINLLKCLANYDASGYTSFALPVYFICGKNDWQVPSVVVEEYFGAVSAPDKKLFWIEDAGHLTDLDNPIEYNNALREICERLSRAGNVRKQQTVPKI
ncbi:MAG: alpha/beta hydrolase [Corallococcus sp.]|nr:alpha/beta hydrolase [Corallococcus sp.]